MTGLAWAADAPAAAAGGMGAIAQFVPLILIFVVFYFLLIRPQQKKAKEHQNYLANLKKGDKVITGGGGRNNGSTRPDFTNYVEIAPSSALEPNG